MSLGNAKSWIKKNVLQQTSEENKRDAAAGQITRKKVSTAPVIPNRYSMDDDIDNCV